MPANVIDSAVVFATHQSTCKQCLKLTLCEEGERLLQAFQTALHGMLADRANSGSRKADA